MFLLNFILKIKQPYLKRDTAVYHSLKYAHTMHLSHNADLRRHLIAKRTYARKRRTFISAFTALGVQLRGDIHLLLLIGFHRIPTLCKENRQTTCPHFHFSLYIIFQFIQIVKSFYLLFINRLTGQVYSQLFKDIFVYLCK